jgi:DNA polymerase V
MYYLALFMGCGMSMLNFVRAVCFFRWREGDLPVLPYYEPRARAGFPSPAEDYSEKRIDLNHQLVKHPAATFFIRVVGDSMTGAGIQSGDVLVVDRSERPKDGTVVVAAVNGELVVKRLRRGKEGMGLLSENPDYGPVPVDEGTEVKVWGVVKHVIHSM